MNLFKRVFAAVLVMAMVISFAGCHKKNETAVTIEGVKFSSAYYMCSLIYADMEARSIVDEANKSTDKTDTSAEEIDYFKQKVEKKPFEKWVKAKAIENLQNIANFKTKCDKAKLKLDDETAKMAEQYASYYWTNYGYSTLFEPNGVSFETYSQYMKDGYYSSLYFNHIYGKDGEKAIAADKVREKTLESFILVDKLEAGFSQKEEADIAALKTQFAEYETALKDGSKTFADLYKQYNDTEEEPQVTADKDGVAPLDKYASLIGSKDTNNAVDYFETVKAMAPNEIKLIELADNAGLVLVIKKDLSADEYFVKQLDESVRYLIEGENFEKDMKKVSDKLEADTNKYAINQFKVKKIKYQES